MFSNTSICFSTPKHKVFIVNCCDQSLSVVNHVSSIMFHYFIVNTLEATLLVQFSSNMLRGILLTRARPSKFNKGDVGTVIRSQGQIIRKFCENFKGHVFSNLHQNCLE